MPRPRPQFFLIKDPTKTNRQTRPMHIPRRNKNKIDKVKETENDQNKDHDQDIDQILDQDQDQDQN